MKHRSVGTRSARGTGVRLEAQPVHFVGTRGWRGHRGLGALIGVAKPAWLRGGSWTEDGVAWQVDEIELVPDEPVISAGLLESDPGLPEQWWAEFPARWKRWRGSRHSIWPPGTPPC